MHVSPPPSIRWFPQGASRAARRSVLTALVVVAATAACDWMPATNPLDPATPAVLQLPGALTGTLALRDVVLDGVAIGEGAAIADVTVTLRDATGRVLGDDGLPLAKSLVAIEEDVDGAPGVRGRFTFDDLVPGTWTVAFSGIPSPYGTPPPTVVEVGPGVEVDVGEVALDYVVDPAVGGPYGIDGAVTVDGPTAGTTRVSLFARSAGGAVFVDQQQVVGAFAFPGLLPGSYAVVVEGEGLMPAWRFDIALGQAQAQASFTGEAAITLHPVSAVLLPVTSGPGAVVVAEGDNHVRGDTVPLAVLAFATDVAGELGVTRMRLSTDPGFRRADGSDEPFVGYAAATTATLPATDGRHTIHAQFLAESAGGFSFPSPVFTLDVVRDTAPPRVVEAALVGLPVVDGVALSPSRVVPFAATVRDDTTAVGAVGVGDDGAPDVLDAVVAGAGDVRVVRSVTFADDGLHTVSLVVRDRAGNDTTGAPTSLPVRVDTVAPDVTLDIEEAPGGVLTGPVATLRVRSRSADDDLLAGFGAQGDDILPTTPLVDDGAGPVATGAVRLPADAEPGGSVTFVAEVVDAVGNRATVTRTVALPPAPTSPQVVVEGGAAATSDTTVRLRLTALNATGVCVVNETREQCFGAAALGTDVDFALATQTGLALLTATFFDAAGNTVVSSAGIVVDTEAPTLGAGGVRLNGGAAFATSVSATLGVDAVGADEMAVVLGAFDGDLGALTFSPYAASAVVLLAATQGPQQVCVVLRDDAGNVLDPRDDADACASVTLDTQLPTSPIVLSPEDDAVQRTPASRTVAVQLAAVDADVVRIEIVVDVRAGVVPLPLVTATVQPGLPTTLSVPVQGDVSGQADTPHLIRLVALDRAGNRSDQATVRVIFDDQLPIAPRIAAADEIAPRVWFPRRGPSRQQRPPKVDSETFAVRLADAATRVDRNFDRYEIARTEGFVVVNGQSVVVTPRPEDFTDVAGTDSLIFSLSTTPTAVFAGTVRGCFERACINHLFLRAVDAAGNVGPSVRVDVVVDQGPPTRPTVSPPEGAMVGDRVDLHLVAESLDDSDVCATDADCADLDGDGVADGTGLVCVLPGFCAPSLAAEGLPIGRYEVKQGTDGAFGPAPGGQPAQGPWRLALVRSSTNEVCVRGVDEGGNVGLEDCALVDEQSQVARFASEAAREQMPQIAGDHVAYVDQDTVHLEDLLDAPRPADERPGDATRIAAMQRPTGALALSVQVARATMVGATPGSDLVALAADTGVGAAAILQVRSGTPAGVRTVGSARAFRGRAPFLQGRSLAFACGSPTRIVVVALDLLFGSSSLSTDFSGVVAVAADLGGRPTFAGVGGEGTCPDDASQNVDVFSVVATLPAGRTLCPGTTPVIEGDGVAWCENDGASGAARVLFASRTVTTPIDVAAVAVGAEGALVATTNTPLQPLLTPSRLVWGEACPAASSTPARACLASRRRVGGGLAPTNEPARGVDVGVLFDSDGEQILYSALRDDGLTNDLFLVDLAAALPPRRLTDDITPNGLASIDGARILASDLSRATEDLTLLRLGADAWLEAGNEQRFLPRTSVEQAVWLAVVDDEIALVAEDIGSGAQTLVASGDALLSQLTFVGGTTLGNSTYDVGGRRISLARQSAPGGAFTVRLLDLAVQPSPPPLVIQGVASADPTQPGDSTVAFDLDVDGDAAAWVDDDPASATRGNVIVRRIDAGEFVDVLSVDATPGALPPGTTATLVVPFVSVDEDAAGTTVVWQVDNAAVTGFDNRRARPGTLHCAQRLAAGATTTGAIQSAPLIPLAGRAPTVARTTAGKVLLAYAEVGPPLTQVRRRAHVCTLDCGVTPPTCTDDRVLGDDGGDSGAPVVSRRGVVAWPNGSGTRAVPQIDLYDVARNVRTSLTAGLGDGRARDEVSVAGSVVLWVDTRLGASDIWTATLP